MHYFNFQVNKLQINDTCSNSIKCDDNKGLICTSNLICAIVEYFERNFDFD